MSEQISRKYGAAEDDGIKRTDQRELASEGEERPEEDWLRPGDPPMEWAAQGRFAGEIGEEDRAGIELRSELARRLTRDSFPTNGPALARLLANEQAPQALLDRVGRLPADATFGSLPELLPALGLPVEH